VIEKRRAFEILNEAGQVDIPPYVLRGSFMLKSVRELQGHPWSRDCCPAFGSKGIVWDSADPSI
jgi:hypothetical protein